MNGTSGLQTGTRSEVCAYVARVRVALSDLPDDEVDELTQGMEADLVELAAESGSIRSRLGAPETYARELRTAAGIAPRAAASPGSGAREHIARWARQRDELRTLPWMRDLQPIGWALRGVAAAWVLAGLTGADRNNVLMWILGAGLSFWVGRKSLDWTGGRRRFMTGLNIVAALVVLFGVLPNQIAGARGGTEVVEVHTTVDGLANNGEPVTSITVYDPTGSQVQQPRLFDQNGNPLFPPFDAGTYTPPATLPPLPRATTTPPTATTTPLLPTTPAASQGQPTPTVTPPAAPTTRR